MCRNLRGLHMKSYAYFLLLLKKEKNTCQYLGGVKAMFVLALDF
jgi:hypothetical protein